MIKVYYVKYAETTIDHIEASSDKAAKALANQRWAYYDDLLCPDDNMRSLGGKSERSSV